MDPPSDGVGEPQERPIEPGEIPVAIGVVRRGDYFLVGVRGPEGPLPGLAEFPGGKNRPGETLEECVVREVLEETGLAVAVRRSRDTVIHRYAHGRLRLTFFDCEEIQRGEPEPPFRWVHRNELPALSFPEANRDLIKELMSGAG